jgi:large subunit ribosomal protein L15
MKLSELKPSAESIKKRKRIGRGPGSGHGKTSGKGHKGQKSISGYKSKAWSEGGQMPLARRIPKRGFTNIFRVDYHEINLGDLERISSDQINPMVMQEAGLYKGKNRLIKILADGKLERPITISAHAFSKTAIEKIEKAGGQAVKIEIKKAVVPSKKGKSV